MTRKPLVVGISGASAPIFGIRTLELLQQVEEIETHLVYSEAARRTIELETNYRLPDVCRLADVSYDPNDFAAAISSGSFQTAGMVIAPCSMSTMAAVASSISNNLLTRAADVTLKERRPIVLMCRESPLHLGHLRKMTQLAEMGAIVAPPVPSFYHYPETIEQLIDHAIGRALGVFGFPLPWLKRWSGPDRD